MNWEQCQETVEIGNNRTVASNGHAAARLIRCRTLTPRGATLVKPKRPQRLGRMPRCTVSAGMQIWSSDSLGECPSFGVREGWLC